MSQSFSNPVSLYKDYLGHDFAQLKHSDALTPIIWRDQSHLDSHTDFISTWLYPVAFYHCIKNIDSLALKHSELLASHRGDLKSKERLCTYLLSAALDSRVLHNLITIQWWCIFISHLYTISVSPYSLIARIINSYGTQWPILDKRYHLC